MEDDAPADADEVAAAPDEADDGAGPLVADEAEDDGTGRDDASDAADEGADALAEEGSGREEPLAPDSAEEGTPDHAPETTVDMDDGASAEEDPTEDGG